MTKDEQTKLLIKARSIGLQLDQVKVELQMADFGKACAALDAKARQLRESGDLGACNRVATCRVK